MFRPSHFCALLLLVACGDTAVDPSATRHSLTAIGDTVLYARPGAPLAEPLAVFVSVDERAAAGLLVDWTVVEGDAVLGGTRSVSGSDGQASVTATAGSGVSRVRAATSRLQRGGVTFTIRPIADPAISSITPAAAAPGTSVTISGSNFADDAVASFAGVRARTLSSTPSALVVEVPACVEPGALNVTVARGAVTGSAAPFSVLPPAIPAPYLDLLPGESRRFSSTADLACIRISADAGSEWLITTHNVRAAELPPLFLEWRGRAAQPPLAGTSTFAERWEVALRTLPAAAAGDGLAAMVAGGIPVAGERRSFSVLDAQNRFQTINATARLVSARAAFFVDDATPTAFSESQLQSFAAVFDDAIFGAVTGVFGTPSDIDGNERVIVLFTPRVNALTPRGEPGYIAGFFYSCDLVSRSRCSGSNRSELFYSMVPDPGALFGDPRSIDDVFATVPPVLAHELQHMIHFARRGFTADELWLSEGLAHTAEDLVAELYAERGDAARAAQFRRANLRRGVRYLLGPQYTSLVSSASPPTSEQRGAAWLFLRYLRSHYGDAVLTRLTASTRTGTANVAFETQRAWSELVADFGVAMWSGAGSPTAVSLAPALTFGTFDLRGALQQEAPGFTLQPFALDWSTGAGGGTHMSSSSGHLLLSAPPGGGSLSATFTARRGLPLTSQSGAAVTVSRIR